MPSQKLWVAMPIIRNIVMYTAKNQNELSAICRMGAITADDLENSELKLSLDQNCAVMDAAFTVSDDPYMGLHIGEHTTPVVLGITGHLMESSKDVFTALQNLQQFNRAFTQLFNFWMEVINEEVFYYCEPIEVWNDISPDTARQSVDIAFAGALHIIKLLTGQTLHSKKIMYRYARVTDTTEHERIFKCRPLFNQEANCIVLNLAELKIPVIGYNKELNGIFINLLQEELKKQQNGESFTSQVRQIILKNFQFSFPPLEEVAARMYMTPRTLQRKLQEENSNFRALSDAIKQEFACHLLSTEELSISDIAYKLGYADASTFQRAFRQWTGKTPGAYRK